jgi:subtilase family serine protease
MRAILESSTGRLSFSFQCTLIAAVVTLTLTFSATALAQESAPPAAARPLIAQPVDESNLTTLTGNTYPLARAEFDLGTAPATLPMERMLLVLKRSPEQEAALGQLLDDQQNRTSPNYHQWLTPEQFGKQFGPSDEDLQTIAAWLQSHGFRVGSTKGRTVLEFSGSASQVQEAFHTTIHKYLVNGEQHWANSSDPQIPTALVPAVAGIESLNNFPRKAMNVPLGVVKRENGKEISTAGSPNPLFTYNPGYQCSADNYCFDIAPYDFATIYNLLPLWNAGIDGTGVTIAISGETDIQMSDVEAFRSMFGLPVNDPVFVPNGLDPGVQGDESEADIDVQWSGAVAKGATIDFVISASTETTSGVDLSAVYIVEQNLAPIMSESYGECELGLGTTGNQFYNALWQQAAAEGITVFISAGDGGSAGCDNFDAPRPAPAKYGLQVSGYASTPYNVAVGGTDFNEFTNPSLYWSTTNNSATQASALGYIPEITWDSSCTSLAFGPPNFSSSPETNCNNSELAGAVDIVGGSGGTSNCTTPSGNTPASCAGGYARPSWQTGAGSFSNDGKRDIPDVSLFASSGWAGTAYVICQADYQGSPCPDSNPRFGGTSVSSPAFAGIMALINQKYGRQGNANYIFYKLAQKSGASCTSSASEATSCIFNDVTMGTNAGPCVPGSPNCQTSNAGDSYGVMSGYNAVAGYDMATGLGSVNANNLVTKWNSVTLLASTTALSSLTPATITHGQAVTFTASVEPASGTGTPSGVLSLEGGPTSGTGAIAGFSLTNGSVSASTDMLPGGTYSVTAHYPGDATYGPSDSTPVSVTVNKENSQPQAFLVTFNSNNQVISHNTNTAVYGSPYILRVNVDNAAGQLCAPVVASGATSCPTGSVTLTNNGTSLDAGTFPLNSYGYSEDFAVQLPGGTNSVKATYAGDESFNASSATAAITITPATTTVSLPSTAVVVVGQPAQISVSVSETGTGAVPTGTVTFYANGAALVGTVTYNQSPGFSASILTNANAFPTAGSYTITATYSGDTNYTGATSPAYNLTVQYQSPNVYANPTSQNVLPGTPVTVSVLVDTTNRKQFPTGTVTLGGGNVGTLAGPTTCAQTTDSSGNYACQATFTFTPPPASVSTSDSFWAEYSGDTNYPASQDGLYWITIIAFSLSPGSPQVTVTQGSPQTVAINVSPVNGFNSAVTSFSCSGLPAETTCGFSPTTVTGGSGSTMLTITTTPLGQLRRRAENESHRIGWMAIAILPLLGICVIGIPSWRRRGVLPVLVIVALFLTLPSCGGGGGTTPPPPNPVPSISSLSPTQQAAGSTSQTLTIAGSGFISGSTVTYNNVAHSASYMSASQLAISLTTSDMAATGTYPVVVTNPTPGGGASGAMNFSVVTGTPVGSFSVTVAGSSGSLTQTTSFTLTIQ